MKEKALGVAAAAVIITSALHMSTYVRPDGVLSFLSASARDSQQKVTVAEPRELSAQELYAIIKHLNNQIEDSVLSSESKTKSQGGSGSAGGSSSNMAPADTGDGSGGSPGGDSGGGSGSGSGSTGETSGQNYYAPIQDVEAKVIGATAVATRAQNTATNVVVNKEVGQTTVPLASLLAQRKNLMMMLAKEDPQLFNLSDLPEEVAKKIPVSLKIEIEKEIDITGRISAYQGEDFENPANAKVFYFVTPDGESKRYSLALINAPQIISGQIFRIKGMQIGSSVVADSSNITEVVGDQLMARPDVVSPTNPDDLPETMGIQRMLVVPVNFVDQGLPIPITRQNLYNRIFNGNFQNFYREQSYNKISFTGQVMDWIDVSGSCRTIDENEMVNMVSSRGINLLNFDRVVLVINANDPNCFGGFSGGMSSIGKSYVFVAGQLYHFSMALVKSTAQVLVYNRPRLPNWAPFESILSHEMGHSLGLYHSKGLDCGTSSLSDDCRNNVYEHSIEYGNRFDVMGTDANSAHFSGFAKHDLEWINDSEVLVISHSGRYTLNPLESATSTNKFAVVQNAVGNEAPFTFEFRRDIGFDAALGFGSLEPNRNGLLGHFWRMLLDMSPTPSAWNIDTIQSTLNGANTFNDQVLNGVTVGPIISVNNNSIVFDVLVSNECVRENPVVTSWFLNDAYSVIGGENIEYLYLFNTDSLFCNDSSIDLQIPMPAPWNYSVTPQGPVQVLPQLSQRKIFMYTVPEETVPGHQLHFNLIAANLDSGLFGSDTLITTAVNGAAISEIIPTSGEVGISVFVEGENFDSPNNNLRVSVVGEQGFMPIADFEHTDSIISFLFPETIFDCSSSPGSCVEIDTIPGFYSVNVTSYGVTDAVLFEVLP